MCADKQTRGGQKWTPEERARLVELLRQEISIEEISEKMGRSERGITMQIRSMVAAHMALGESHVRIAKACGLSLEDVETIVEGLEAKLEDRVAALEREVEDLKRTVIALQHRK